MSFDESKEIENENEINYTEYIKDPVTKSHISQMYKSLIEIHKISE